MLKPHIKKLGTVNEFNVWLVDGEYIRNNVDEEFTNFGQHYHYKFIPENEFWIDNERTPGEEEFYIDHLLLENKLMSEGLGYEEALEKADQAEKKERRKVDFFKKDIKNPYRKEYVERVHKQLLEIYSKYLRVWIIDGELVRDLFFIDFTEGGYDKVYSFIPAREVWIDDDLSFGEIRYVLLHELHERHLMSRGMEYHQAHRSASHIEYYCRNHPESLDNRLKQEIERNRS